MARGEKNNVNNVKIIISDSDFCRGLCRLSIGEIRLSIEYISIYLSKRLCARVIRFCTGGPLAIDYARSSGSWLRHLPTRSLRPPSGLGINKVCEPCNFPQLLSCTRAAICTQFVVLIGAQARGARLLTVQKWFSCYVGFVGPLLV